MQAPRVIKLARVEAVGEVVMLFGALSSAGQVEGATTRAIQPNPAFVRIRLRRCRLDRMGRSGFL